MSETKPFESWEIVEVMEFKIYVKCRAKPVCGRCEGDGQAHGSDRPFEWSGPGTYPGPCPVCKGSGVSVSVSSPG